MAIARRVQGAPTVGAVDVFAVLAARLDPEICEVPAGEAIIRLQERDGEARDLVLDARGARLTPVRAARPDAVLSADAATWRGLAHDVRSGMDAYRRGALVVRGNLHVGVGFIAATAHDTGPGRLRFRQVQCDVGTVSVLVAGSGPPVLMAHGLGATKASFLPTVAALAASHTCIAMDLPGFGDTDKPLFASYNAAFFSRWMLSLLDAMGIVTADVIGHSMGGRAAIEFALLHRERVRRLVLMCPSLAWRRNREWAALLRLVRPELGMLQIAPRAVVERILERILPEAGEGWAAAGKDEFLRAYLTPAGRAAFYAAARQIYLEAPDGAAGFWTRLGELRTPSLWIWGRRDGLVPAAFQRHVSRSVPEARHVTVESGHVPQLERPRETHAAIGAFLR